MAKYVIYEVSEAPVYVSQAPDIRFTMDESQALHLSKIQAVITMEILMDFQMSSSFTAPSYAIKCVEK